MSSNPWAPPVCDPIGGSPPRVDYTGPQGPPGEPGAPGMNGLPGPQGPAGEPGPQGPQGVPGVSDIPGPVGPLGPTGATGAASTVPGPTGTTGATGPLGPVGATGADGPVGARGLTGVQGPLGPAGATGATGAQGIEGPNGPIGGQGPAGTPGVQGPQGVQGVTGSTGTVGATGTTGGTGVAGATGATGAASTVAGPAGTAGATGATGTTGTTGLQGTPGAQGIQGATGSPGAPGSQGTPGIQGPVGPIGATGATGATPLPGGVNTQVQFNDSGAFGGDAGMTYAKATDVLTVGGVTTGAINASSAVVNPGVLTVTGGGRIVTTGSSGTIAAVAGAGPAKLELQAAGTAGDASMIAFHRPGIFAGIFGLDTDNQWKVGGWSYGAVSYKILHEANSFTIDGSGNLNLGARIIYGTGYVQSGTVSGGYSWLGAYSGALDFRTMQSFGVGAGSTITSIVALAGQICRILVNGSGLVNLPASVKWADGSPVWGTVQTIVSMWTDSGTFWATTTPYNT